MYGDFENSDILVNILSFSNFYTKKNLSLCSKVFYKEFINSRPRFRIAEYNKEYISKYTHFSLKLLLKNGRSKYCDYDNEQYQKYYIKELALLENITNIDSIEYISYSDFLFYRKKYLLNLLKYLFLE